MGYYEVLIGDMQFHGQGALTYSAEGRLPVGAIVLVRLRERPVLGIVSAQVTRPTFAVKPISRYDPSSRPLPAQTLQLLEWLRQYYPAPLGAVVRQFLPPVTSSPPAVEAKTVTDKSLSKSSLPPLTVEQKDALKQLGSNGLSILHGVTGSGKTRIYLELASQAMISGKSAIILTPEIGLTAQLVASFEAQFPSRTVVFHSQLTAATRRNLWYRILNSNQPLIIIGPRSALFTPVQKIGLIVIDEAHESSYKNESAPHYVASRVAAKLAGLHNAACIIGSATPSVEDYFVASEKQLPIVRMTHSAAGQSEGSVALSVVDLKDQTQFTRSRIVSHALQQAIAEAIGGGSQALIFLNRRGTAKVVLCNVCGWQVHCPRCDLPLVYHQDEHILRCHTCGFRASLPSSCPICGSPDILLKGIGTKALASELQKLFPNARLQRFDTDSAKDERLEQNMSALQTGKIDIIVGTQIIAKGLDLPKLAVVGVVNADTSLFIPDYTAAERTYQLLSQVIGRVGRGHRNGKVIVQTYNPANPTLLAALRADWQTFYQGELQERKQYLFPPYCYLLMLDCARASAKSAEKAATELQASLQAAYPTLVIDGPSPAFHTKTNNKYHWRLVVKAKRRQDLLQIIHDLPSGWSYDIDPVNLL
jgi:primosomal protein N' (replication factor Y)